MHLVMNATKKKSEIKTNTIYNSGQRNSMPRDVFTKDKHETEICKIEFKQLK